LPRREPCREERLATAPRAILSLASVGYLVPDGEFAGSVHSVFARACNFIRGEELWTLLAPDGDPGPTVLRLARSVPCDLRRLFAAGERLACRAGIARTQRVAFRIRGVPVWRPGPLEACLAFASIDTHLRRALQTLAPCGGIADAAPCNALEAACRTLDGGRALPALRRLIGRGEGLTPAGDDFLVGLVAGLERLTAGDAERARFLGALAKGIEADTVRTTPIAAHALRQAVRGHHGAAVLALREALLCDADFERVAQALAALLCIGASSGAAMASGLLAGLRAWGPA
jgi:hypothetical protein